MTRRALAVRTTVRAVVLSTAVLVFVFLPDTVVNLLTGAPQ